MSEKALVYFEGDLRHRMLVLYEHSGVGGKFSAYAIRSLLSEGCLKYMYTDIEAAKKSVMVEIEGPTGLITSTARSIDNELQTRLVSVNIEDSPELTAAIIAAQAREAAGITAPDIDREPYHALMRLVALDVPAVIVPFAETLAAKMVNIKAVRIRRDFPAVMGLVKAHALLHRQQRETDREGRLLAARPTTWRCTPWSPTLSPRAPSSRSPRGCARSSR